MSFPAPPFRVSSPLSPVRTSSPVLRRGDRCRCRRRAVVALAAVERVVAIAAVEHVVAGFAVERVFAVSSVHVSSLPPMNDVVAVAAVDHVGRACSDERVVAVGPLMVAMTFPCARCSNRALLGARGRSLRCALAEFSRRGSSDERQGTVKNGVRARIIYGLCINGRGFRDIRSVNRSGWSFTVIQELLLRACLEPHITRLCCLIAWACRSVGSQSPCLK